MPRRRARIASVRHVMLARRRGRVYAALPSSVFATLPSARVGESVTIQARDGARIAATVTRVEAGRVALATHLASSGIGIGDAVESDTSAATVPLGMRLLGRAIAASGEPLDNLGASRGRPRRVLDPPISAVSPQQLLKAVIRGSIR